VEIRTLELWRIPQATERPTIRNALTRAPDMRRTIEDLNRLTLFDRGCPIAKQPETQKVKKLLENL